jgi:hypothetical protein
MLKFHLAKCNISYFLAVLAVDECDPLGVEVIPYIRAVNVLTIF